MIVIHLANNMGIFYEECACENILEEWVSEYLINTSWTRWRRFNNEKNYFRETGKFERSFYIDWMEKQLTIQEWNYLWNLKMVKE